MEPHAAGAVDRMEDQAVDMGEVEEVVDGLEDTAYRSCKASSRLPSRQERVSAPSCLSLDLQFSFWYCSPTDPSKSFVA